MAVFPSWSKKKYLFWPALVGSALGVIIGIDVARNIHGWSPSGGFFILYGALFAAAFAALVLVTERETRKNAACFVAGGAGLFCSAALTNEIAQWVLYSK